MYSRSRGVSKRTRTVNSVDLFLSISCAVTIALDASPFSSPEIENISSFNYVIRVYDNKRQDLIDHLKLLGIETGIHWTPVHKFSYFSESKKGDLTITEKIADEILTLPLHSNMKQESIQRVIDGVTSFYK